MRIDAIVQTVFIGPRRVSRVDAPDDWDFENLICTLHFTGPNRGISHVIAYYKFPLDVSLLVGKRLNGNSDIGLLYGKTAIAKMVSNYRIEFAVRSIRDAITAEDLVESVRETACAP